MQLILFHLPFGLPLSAYGGIGPFSTSQIIAVGTFVLAVAFLFARRRGHEPFPHSDPELMV